MILLYRGQKTLFMHCSCTVHRSHDTIHTFKNYFATVFSVFSFSNNKFNSNGPICMYNTTLHLNSTVFDNNNNSNNNNNNNKILVLEGENPFLLFLRLALVSADRFLNYRLGHPINL